MDDTIKNYLDNVVKYGITIKSSGTSGPAKEFDQSVEKIHAASKVARRVQNIGKNSRIYTCCKLTHAGGLFAQTVPGYMIGAHIDIEPFNAYEFVKKIQDYTHTHITPLHAKAIMGTKGFKELDLSGITIMCGSEPVTWDIIESFVARGCHFIVNWGMSEIGPVVINHRFTSMEEVRTIKAYCPKDATVMGSNCDCDYLIPPSEELIVKSKICIYNGWYPTGDRVVKKESFFFYRGRLQMEVDFNNPRKG